MKLTAHHKKFSAQKIKRGVPKMFVTVWLILLIVFPLLAQAAQPDNRQRTAVGTPFEEIRDSVAALSGALDTMTAKVSGLERQLADIKQLIPPNFDLVEALRKCIVVIDHEIEGLPGPHVIFRRCNVHVQSGMTVTEGPVNGLGNLIIGYNERTEDFYNENPYDIRLGSHNLIIGPGHSYDSFGGLITGKNNTITGEHASIVGGSHNRATGNMSTVGGGLNISSDDDFATKSNEINVVSIGGSQLIDIDPDDGDVIIRTVNLTAPTSGQAVVISSGHYRALTGVLNCSITQGTTVEGEGPAPHFFTTGAEQSFGATRTFPVNAGVSTFRLVCHSFDSFNPTDIHRVLHSELNAIFVPTSF